MVEDPFGFNRQGGGNHSLYAFDAAQPFPPGGCPNCDDDGVLGNATAIRLLGIRGGAIVADETFPLTSSLQHFVLTDPDWLNVSRVVFENRGSDAVGDEEDGLAVIDNILAGTDAVDDDSDGVINLHEQLLGTNPLLPNTLQLSEGATGFFEERIALANPTTEVADVELTFSVRKETGGRPVVPGDNTVLPRARQTGHRERGHGELVSSASLNVSTVKSTTTRGSRRGTHDDLDTRAATAMAGTPARPFSRRARRGTSPRATPVVRYLHPGRQRQPGGGRHGDVPARGCHDDREDVHRAAEMRADRVRQRSQERCGPAAAGNSFSTVIRALPHASSARCT